VRNVSVIGRAAAVVAVLVVGVAVAVILLGGDGENYKVKARFQNAAQLVQGNLVQVSGKAVGKVERIELTDDGQAELTLSINDDYAPLREGTKAVVRASSLSGIANRYIDLQLGPSRSRGIPKNGVIQQTDTITAVDLDELFNLFGPRERRALSGVLRGSATQYAARGEQGNRGLLYLNPSIAATTALFRELNRNEGEFRRFVKSTARLVSDVSERRTDLAGLISNLSQTTGAIGAQRDALADAIQQLPDFMRRANTTFVNLRAALDDLEPLVDASKPVAKKLRPFLAELRPLARDARPTIRDLSQLVNRAGSDNDLIDLTRSNPAVRDIAVGPVQANGRLREGAFPAATRSLEGATPELSFAKPYAGSDLMGWFDDFSHTGFYDALGGTARAALHVNLFTIANGFPVILDPNNPAGSLIPPDQRDDVFLQAAQVRHDNRCPGAMERPAPDRSNLFRPSPDYNCDPSQVPPGP
jgi:phospholipid/cholesterol/gamma-HCH transport system substrate-binding protein